MKSLALVLAVLAGGFAHANQQESKVLASEIKAAVEGGQMQFLDRDAQDRVLFHLRSANRLLNGEGPVEQQNIYSCVSVGNGYFGLFNLKQNKQIGQAYNSLSNCQASLPKPGSRYACASVGNGYYGFHDLATGEQIGQAYNSLSSCQSTLPDARTHFACVSIGNGYYGLFNLVRGEQVGQAYNSLSTCKSSLPN